MLMEIRRVILVLVLDIQTGREVEIHMRVSEEQGGGNVVDGVADLAITAPTAPERGEGGEGGEGTGIT